MNDLESKQTQYSLCSANYPFPSLSFLWLGTSFKSLNFKRSLMFFASRFSCRWRRWSGPFWQAPFCNWNMVLVRLGKTVAKHGKACYINLTVWGSWLDGVSGCQWCTMVPWRTSLEFKQNSLHRGVAQVLSLCTKLSEPGNKYTILHHNIQLYIIIYIYAYLCLITNIYIYIMMIYMCVYDICIYVPIHTI